MPRLVLGMNQHLCFTSGSTKGVISYPGSALAAGGSLAVWPVGGALPAKILHSHPPRHKEGLFLSWEIQLRDRKIVNENGHTSSSRTITNFFFESGEGFLSVVVPTFSKAAAIMPTSRATVGLGVAQPSTNGATAGSTTV